MYRFMVRTAILGAVAAWSTACSDPATNASDAKDSAGGDSNSATADVVSGGDATGKDGTVGSDSGGDGLAGDASPTKSVLTPRPLRFEADLFGIWGSAADDVWAVGDKGTILHWNGKVLVPRNSGVTTALRGVGGTGPQDVWFVGDAGKALHWDGKTVADQSPGAGEITLRAVASPPDGSTVLVAGDAGTVYRRQEGAWKPEATKATFNVNSLAMAGGGQGWAVGDQGQALKLSGGVWSAQSLPKANTALRAVARSPAGRWYACGDQGYLASTQAGAWEATLANDTLSRDVTGLWAKSDSEAWAVGKLGLLLHMVGGKWLLLDIDGTYMKQASLRALWGISPDGGIAEAYAVGDKGSGLRFDAATSKWQDFRAETTSDLRQIVAMADGAVVACGTGGAVLRAADATAPFYDLAAPITAADVWDCAAVGDTLWIGGSDGVAASWTASLGWKVEKTGMSGAVTGLTALGSEVLAVSDTGQAALRKAGGGWTIEKTANQLPLRSVAAAGKIAIAVGDVGTALRRDEGGTWTPEALAETGDLHRVIGWGEAEAMAVGDFGAVWVRKAGTWTKGFEAPELPLYGATRKADGTLIAVGWQGTLVVAKAGGPFAQVNTNTPGVLRGIVSTAKGTLAVGLKGGIFGVAESLP